MIDGVRPEIVRFGADAGGLPQLSGWWIPASPGSRFGRLAVLFLPREDRSLAGSVPALTALHRAGVSVFGLDFRGYGQSAATHPSEARMNEDADAAMAYLGDTRHLAAGEVIPFGVGVSGAIAARLAGSLVGTPALILEDPEPAVADRLRGDPRVRLLPVRLLLRDRFALVPRLAKLRTPKLIVTGTAAEDAAMQSALDPKITAVVPTTDRESLVPLLRRFLDQYAPATPTPELLAQPGSTQ